MIWTITFYDDVEHRQIAHILSFDDSCDFLRVANALEKSLSSTAYMRVSYDVRSVNPLMEYHICRYSNLRNSVKRITAIHEELKKEVADNV